MMEKLFAIADRFLPQGLSDADGIRKARATVLQSWLGVFFTVVFGAIYAAFGSPWSGAAILLITVGLLIVPFLVKRNVSVLWIGNVLIGQTWLATLIVVTRSGGFPSPALAWNFLLPLCVYPVGGRRAALFWSGASAAQISGFFVAELLGASFWQDFDARTLAILRISGFAGVILATITILLAFESARAASAAVLERAQRALERERILDDVHDGVGSQLLGLIVRSRSKTLPEAELLSGLESCLDDLRLIVDSLESLDQSFDLALAALRARVQARCEAGNIELTWGAIELGSELSPERSLHVLRALQELVTNAQRHAQTSRIDVSISASTALENGLDVTVRDHGKGFDLSRLSHGGRGLKSLKTRARKLGGELLFEPAQPGTRATLRFARQAAPETR
jgi:signal transduction histidine kinase